MTMFVCVHLPIDCMLRLYFCFVPLSLLNKKLWRLDMQLVGKCFSLTIYPNEIDIKEHGKFIKYFRLGG